MTTTTRWTIAVTALLLICGLSACASSGETKAEPASAEEAVPANTNSAIADGANTPTRVHSKKKIHAPVQVELTTSGATGQVKASMLFTATADIPQVTARFKIPNGVALVRGKAREELGALKKGESRTLEVILSVPVGNNTRYLLAGAVDCQMSVGVKLAGSAVAHLGDGQPASDDTRVIDGVRMQTVKPTK